MKLMNKIIWGVLSVTAVLLLLAIQHIACYDLWNSNFAYLYVIAIVSAVLQYFVVYLIRRFTAVRLLLWMIGGVYILLTIIVVRLLLLMVLYDNPSRGLTILCTVLNLLGVGTTIYQLVRTTKINSSKTNK